MPSPTHLILRAAVCLSAACLPAGCTSSDARAQRALSDYQSAAAANDLARARRALLQLVQAKDDVPDYWVKLGRLQASIGSYGDAYYAFTRAYELDSSNVEILRSIIGLALRNGDIALAVRHTRELEVLAPGDPWIKLTRGWAAIGESRYDDALADADAMLATDPFNSAPMVLKGRALLGLGREDEAVQLLTKQVQSQPSDAGSLQLLSRIYVGREDWAKTADVARRLSELTPKDSDNWLLLIEAAFRSGNVVQGRAASSHLLRANAKPAVISAVLDVWTDYSPSPQRVADARTLALASKGLEQRLVYAAFLNRLGSPADGLRLSAPSASLPVSAENAEANAVVADAWLRMGKLGDAKSRFDAVLAFDPGNATALRGRSELALKAGNSAAAIVDAQKLVTVLPTSARDRLLLAKAYIAAGNRAWADRTLWAAFKEIPGDERIFAALESSKKGNKEALLELKEEFLRQRYAKLRQGLL